MCVWVQTICFALRPRFSSRSRIAPGSSPGSMTIASPVVSSPSIVQLHESKPTGNVSMIIYADASLRLFSSQHRQSAPLCAAAALEINAAYDFFVARRQLLFHDEFVVFQDRSLVVQVSRLELDLVVGVSLAAVAQADDPDRLVSRQFRPEFRTCYDDIALRICATKPQHDRVAVRAVAENQNNADQDKPARNDPLPGAEKLKHYCLGASCNSIGRSSRDLNSFPCSARSTSPPAGTR